ncbi:MAG: CrcB family protein [Anaerovoracaceae bacterium]
MNIIVNIILVGLGGAIGSIIRFFISSWTAQKKNPLLGTLFVNVTGSIILALIVNAGLREGFSLLLGVGLMGGYTTFSTFNYEVCVLLKKKALIPAFGYVCVMYISCIVSVLLVFFFV